MWTPDQAAWWAEQLETNNVKCLLAELKKRRPPPACHPLEHQTIYSHGAVAGYEQYEVNLISMSKPIGQRAPAPQANYGVKDKLEKKADPA